MPTKKTLFAVAAASTLAVATADTIGTMPDTFTIPQSEFDGAPSGCTALKAGCTGTFVNGDEHAVEGMITVIDDCTFEISGWQFDGEGPAVEWWAAMQEGPATVFPYPANAIKIGELGEPGNYQTGSNNGGDSEVVVRLGLDASGQQILLNDEFDHISLWCEQFAVDFGNAALSCPEAAPEPPVETTTEMETEMVAPEVPTEEPTAFPATEAMTGMETIGEMEDTFTIPQSEFSGAPSGCSTLMAGCTGQFVNGALHEVEGMVTVIDDCTFEISGWQFDGLGPAVEWWAATQEGPMDVFPYPANARKIGELGEPGNYQTGSNHGGDSEVVVRLGLDEAGEQILLSSEFNHISLWCEQFVVDFGNAALTCPENPPAAAGDTDGAAMASDATARAGEAGGGDAETETGEDSTPIPTMEQPATAALEASTAAPVSALVSAGAAAAALAVALL